MTTPRWILGLLAVSLLLSGCAGASGASGAGRKLPATADGPPARAAMVCGSEISGELTQILKLTDAPHLVSAWTKPVYTCTYRLPDGPLVLSVNVSDSNAAAGAYFDDRQSSQPTAEPFVGLGERAFRTADGTVTVVKDDMTLTVDATGLPAVFGANHQTRSALAFEVGSTVLGCWTEHE
jgi:hypothetical protein